MPASEIPPIPTPIDHISCIDNLPTILQAGGLRAKNRLGQAAYTNIAHRSIQGRRSTTPVRCGPGGTVHDYVPFYFATRSPMLFAISKGAVEGYQGGQEAVIYLLVTTAQAVLGADIPFVFTDGHAAMALSQYATDLAQLSIVDWEAMRSTMWTDTMAHPDRRRRRQAEFLVHQFVPWDLLTEIGVVNSRVQARVRAMLSEASRSGVANVRSNWYY